MPFTYFVYAEIFDQNASGQLVDPAKNDGVTHLYSGTVTRDVQLNSEAEFIKLRRGLAEIFRVEDDLQVVIKSLTVL